MVDVGNYIEAGESELLVLNFLHENNVQLHCLDECSQRVDFVVVRDGV